MDWLIVNGLPSQVGADADPRDWRIGLGVQVDQHQLPALGDRMLLWQRGMHGGVIAQGIFEQAVAGVARQYFGQASTRIRILNYFADTPIRRSAYTKRGVRLPPFSSGFEHNAFPLGDSVYDTTPELVELLQERPGRLSWDLSIGDTIPRRELHDRYGGTRSGVVSPSSRTPNVFIFERTTNNQRLGLQQSSGGTLLCICDEEEEGYGGLPMRRAALLFHIQRGRTLRLFEQTQTRGLYTYLGTAKVDQDQPLEGYEARKPRALPPARAALRSFVAGEQVPSSRLRIFRAPIVRLTPSAETVPSAYAGRRNLLGRSYIRPPTVVVAKPQPQGMPELGHATIQDVDTYGRGLNAHRSLQNYLADHVSAAGLTPLSPGVLDPQFDLGWHEPSRFVIVEVKSLAPANETGQLRLGIGQLLDYRFEVEVVRGASVLAVLFVERPPSNPRWVHVAAENGIRLCWPESLPSGL